MKKLLILLGFISMMAYCCGPRSPDPKPKADSGYFTVESIEAVKEDSAKKLCLYTLLSDTMHDCQSIANKQQSNNPFRIIYTDTSGKYAVGDTLILILKPIPDPYGKTDF